VEVAPLLAEVVPQEVVLQEAVVVLREAEEPPLNNKHKLKHNNQPLMEC
jgi:hypothetical protein